MKPSVRTKEDRLLPSWRALVSLLTFFGFMNFFIVRTNLPVAIVCMVNHTALASVVNSSEIKFSDCGAATDNVTEDMEDGDLPWSKEVQGSVLSAFSWGYVATQILGGTLSLRFGGKIVLTSATLFSSLATFLSPVVARLSPWGLIALRIIIGLSGGVIMPAGFTLLSKWTPPNERSVLVGGAVAGGSFGGLLASISSGVLCRYGFAGGWPSIFYIHGVIGLIWCLLTTILVTDSPRSHSWISQRELNYIEGSLRGTVTRTQVYVAVPWLKMLTSRAVWALIVTHSFSNYAVYTYQTMLPTYLREVSGFTITENGILTALPLFGKILVMASVSSISTWMLTKRILRRLTVRKLFNSIGQIPIVAFTLGITLLPCSHIGLSIVFITLAMAFTGAHEASGFILTPSDIAPQFAGLLFGISNTVANIPGVLVPAVASVMTPQGTRLEWNNVFYLASGICLFGTIFYLFFASADLQEWARPKFEEEEIDEEEEEETLDPGHKKTAVV